MAAPKVLYDTTTEMMNTVADYRPYTVAQYGSLTEQIIRIFGSGTAAMGSSHTCDAIGIANHNIGTEGITVTIESTDDTVTFPVSWTQRAQFNPTHDGPILYEFTPASDNYWRVKFSAAATNPLYLGLLYFGEVTEMPMNFDAGIDPRSEIPLTNRDFRAESGYLLTPASRGLTREFDFQLEPVGATKAEHTNTLDAFWTHVRKYRPFFFNYNTDDAFFDTLVLRLRDGGINRPFVFGGYARMGFSFSAISAIPEEL